VHIRKTSFFLAFVLGAPFLASVPCLSAAEKTITIAGRVDVSGLDAAAGAFTVRALQPQKRSVELGKAATNSAGDFQLSVDGEALALYGVILEASSGANRALVLESAILRARDAASPVVVDSSSTVEAAVLDWKIRAHGADLDAIRPGQLTSWLRPLTEPKTRSGLKRAQTALAKWAIAATPPSTLSAVLRAAVGDIRLIAKRLKDLGVAPAAIAEIEQTARKDAEVAYLLMMPYFLDL
jgi:hypothetical protein